MPDAVKIFLQFVTLAVAAFACALGDVSVAYAQSNACAQLQNSLAALERNGDFRSYNSNASRAKRMQEELQRSESSYVRQGCNDDAKAGRPLNNQCKALARKILDGREQVSRMNDTLGTASAISNQREAILQEMSRFDCGRSNGRVQRQNRGNLFDQLFDMFNDRNDGAGGTREEEFQPYGGYHTVRTLCVRKSDGFYWPISYSTLVDYVVNDVDQCRAQCPQLDVDLYYYDNPGQEPEQMINLNGQPYRELPNAFRFRTDFDRESRCQAATTYGSISIADLGDGRTRPVINFDGDTFPMPVRDPRQQATVQIAAVQTAEYIDVPLPRRRPAAPGETPAPVLAVTPPSPPATTTAPPRIIQFREKRVRIVGPDTPYAQVAAVAP